MTVTDAAAGGGGFVGAVCEVLDGEAAVFIGVGVTEVGPTSFGVTLAATLAGNDSSLWTELPAPTLGSVLLHSPPT